MVGPGEATSIVGYASFLVGVSSFVAGGSLPRARISDYQACSSAAHASMLEGLVERVLDWLALGATVSFAPDSGRKGDVMAAALDRARLGTKQSAVVAGLEGYRRTFGVRVDEVATCALRPLRASRIAFPAEAGTWDIAKWLPPEVLKAFLDPSVLQREDPGVARRATVRGTLAEFTLASLRIDAAGGLELADDDEVPRDHEGTPIKNGYFPIYKDAATDRTITNSTVSNAFERSLGYAARLLGHAVAICEIILEEDEEFRGSGRDLPDCYHSIRVALLRAFRNAVGPWLSPASMRQTAAYARLMARRRARGVEAEPARVVACWSTLVMGDLNAVDFVQIAHINALRSGGCMGTDAALTYTRPLPDPADKVYESVVVDDYNAIAVVKAGTVRGADEERVQLADAMYAREGREPKPSKCYNGATVFHPMGATVGRRSTQAGLELQGRALLLGLRLLETRRCTPGFWDALVGLLSYCAFVGGRMGFSLFEQVYHETRGLARGEVFAPSSRALAELEVILALLPMLFVDNGATVAGTIYATDASSGSAAIVETQVSERTARELWRFRCRNGKSMGLLTLAEQLAARLEEDDVTEAEGRARDLLGLLDGEDGESDEPEDQPAAWVSALADALGWRLVAKWPVDPRSHINRKEGIPLSVLCKRVARNPRMHRRKHVALIDSSVNLASWARGRSRSPTLNAVIRRGFIELLMVRSGLGVLHCRSKHNPADAPTRGRLVRGRPRRAPEHGSALRALLDGTWRHLGEIAELAGQRLELPDCIRELWAGPGPATVA